jgi:mono/diheme cytochrome c family protein
LFQIKANLRESRHVEFDQTQFAVPAERTDMRPWVSRRFCAGNSVKCRRSQRIGFLRVSLCAAAGWSFGPSVEAATDDIVEKGRDMVQENCARCHAIGMSGASTHPKAPPFRIVIKRYPVEDLAEALAEGIVSGHPAMPQFVFQPAEISAILAYLNSLKTPTNDK